MKVNFTNNKLSFKKLLMGNCNVLKSGKPYKCNMYLLENDKQEDCDFFIKPTKENYQLWDNPEKSSYFWLSMMEGWHPSEEVYILEDENNNCLGFMDTNTEGRLKQKALFFLETCPKYSHENAKKRDIKYIGETMMAFLAGIAQKKHNPFISVPAYRTAAVDFYTKNCGFTQTDYDDDYGLVLTEDNYDKLIKQNELHTGRRIDVFK